MTMAIDEQVVYRQLFSCDDEAFPELYDVYVDSLPARERKGRNAVAAMCSREDYKVLVAERGRTVIGFSTVFAPPGERFCLLEYLAVRRDWRGRGVGTGLFRQSQLAAGADDDATMLLEVDLPLPSSSDYQVATRRMAFYQRLGCMRIEALEYILPLPGDGPPPEMRLLVYRPGAFSAIGKSTLQRWLELVYTIVYGTDRCDERIAQMMATVSDPVELGMPVN